MFTATKALLIDLDGTLYFREVQIPGANEAISKLRKAGLALRFLTNTDSIHSLAIHAKVRSLGLEIEPDEIFCPSVAVLNFFSKHPSKSCYFLVSSQLDEVFADLNKDETQPDYVVIGDCSDKVSYKELNRAFRYIKQGAEILALSKSPFFYNADGSNLDTGAFVALFEFATKKQASILGKPSPFFFDVVLTELGLQAEDVVVVGDDVNTDVLGAGAIGAKSVLLRTGKFTPQALDASIYTPDAVLDSIAQLPGLFLK